MSVGEKLEEETILVLYGSQTGNSEQAAQDICEQINDENKLSYDNICKLVPGKISPSSSLKNKKIVAKHMQLDDFLEIELLESTKGWTRLVVIITSSYGVGQAPLGAYRFRELCDEIIESKNDKMLNGITYAMLGLGDSKYTTFFQNPTVINEALTQAGAKRIGPLGKADASGVGKDEQQVVIKNWIGNIWADIAGFLATSNDTSDIATSQERLEEINKETIQICCKINPDFKANTNVSGMNINLTIVLMIAIVSALAAFAFKHYNL